MRNLLSLNGLFDTAHDPFQNALFGTMLNPNDGEIWEKDGVTFIELPMPGVKPEDVDIQVQENIVNVTWKRKIRGTEEKTYRNYQVSKEIDAESIQAKVENGLLTMELRKTPKASPRKIPILGASSVKAME